MVSLLLTALDHGAKVVTLPRFESESFLNCLNQHHVSSISVIIIDFLIQLFFYNYAIRSKPTVLPIVPLVVSFLALHPAVKLEAFRRLHSVIIGGAPLGPAIANKFVERLGKDDLLIQEGSLGHL